MWSGGSLKTIATQQVYDGIHMDLPREKVDASFSPPALGTSRPTKKCQVAQSSRCIPVKL